MFVCIHIIYIVHVQDKHSGESIQLSFQSQYCLTFHAWMILYKCVKIIHEKFKWDEEYKCDVTVHAKHFFSQYCLTFHSSMIVYKCVKKIAILLNF